MRLYVGSLSLRRVIFLVLTGLVVLFGTLFFARIWSLLWDETIVLLVISCIFLLVLYIFLLKKRLSDKLPSTTSYMPVFLVILLSYLFLYIASFFDSFLVPYIILSLILVSALDGATALGCAVFIVCIYARCRGLSYNVTYHILILSVLGVFLGSSMKTAEKPGRILISLMTFFSAFLIPVFFRFLSVYNLEFKSLLYSAITALISAFFIGIVYNLLYRFFSRETSIRYDIIMDENYSILKDLRATSQAEYRHALSVSRLSGICAGEIGADVMLVRAAGLYYHASSIYDGVDELKFAKRLNNRCFPPELIAILLERGENGIIPSSKEAAIVHMTDNLITKFEAIFRTADKSSWNINMVVYQTLNELSSQGIYDDSGLSMNEFLKIRDTLAKLEYGA